MVCWNNKSMWWVRADLVCRMTGGKCVLPDLCQCDQWAAKLFIDGRDVFKNGRNIPVFQRNDGEQQFTGWTGYDCSTRAFFVAASGNSLLTNDSLALLSYLRPSRKLDPKHCRRVGRSHLGGTCS